MSKRDALIASLVVLLLAGAGYRWTVLSRRTPPPEAPAPAGAWCKEHGVAEADCFVCDPSLVQSRGFCREHGVPEAHCTRCHPKLRPIFEALHDWCAEHGLPESQCAACGGADGAPPTAVEQDLKVVHDPADPADPDRRQRPPSPRCLTHALRVQLRGPDVAARIGLALAPVERRSFREVLTCNAELAWDAGRYAHVAARAPGIVHAVAADLGTRVEAGQVLATVESTALGEAEAGFLEAQALSRLWTKNFAREASLAERGVGTQRAVLEAETEKVEAEVALARARQRLKNLGVGPERLAALEAGADPDPLLAVRAPFAGVVVERHAVQGEVVDAGAPLLVVADPSRLWVQVHVPEEDQARIAAGQEVVVTLDALRGESWATRLDWVGAEVDRRTRTVTARAPIDNAQGALRANLFGKARIALHAGEPALLVPRGAVQWEGCCNVVFVPESATRFAPRKVTLGCATETSWEVVAGLAEGEPVVTTGSFLLKTEILKGSIGAGCCEGDE